MTDKNIQEAPTGGGTKIADKSAEKRAQLSLKMIQLRMKQNKEREALAAQRKSLQSEETVEESFSPSQIAALKAEYSKINTVDPDSDTYKKLIAMIDKLDLKSLQSLAGAEIKFVSKLAQNRVLRKSTKKEEVERIKEDEMSQKKKEQVVTVRHKDSGKEIRVVKTAVADYQKRGYHPVKEEVESIDEQHSVLYKMKKSDPKIAVAHYKSKDDADKFLASVKEKGGNGVVRVGKIGLDLTSTDKKINELSTDKLADYKKKAGDSASAADKAGDTKKGNKRFSGIMKATRKQFDNDAKNEEVSNVDEASAEPITDRDIKMAIGVIRDKRYAGGNMSGAYNTIEKIKKGLASHPKVKAAMQTSNEELSPKQKEIDKNKNGKIDGFDLSHLRKKKTEELSPAQKAIDKNKNGKIDGTDLAHLRDKKKPQGADFAAQRRKERLASNGRMDEAKSDYEVYHKDYSGAVQAAIKQAEKRGFEVDMDDWHDKVATGPKKPSAGKTNSFSVKLKKDGKESKKALHLQVYNMDNHKYELNMYIEEIQLDELNKDTLHSYAKKSEKDQDDQFNKIGKGIRDNDPKSANKAGHKFSMRSIGQNRAEKRLAKEAASPAQQAAIAIAMKKAGKKPKDMEESDAYDKNVKPSDKPHDKEAAAKRAKLAALAARKKMVEGIMDKIKALKSDIKSGLRGVDAKSKAASHWDLAMNAKNMDERGKHIKKAISYSKVLNKEETEIVVEAKKKTWKDMRKKKKTKNEESPDNNTISKSGEPLSGKKEPIEVSPVLKN